MSRVIRTQWPGNPLAPYRRGRIPCDYEAYVPDLLAERAIRLDGSSSRGESHPPALTEPCLTVSRYTALLI
jgi:hypothetical protein